MNLLLRNDAKERGKRYWVGISNFIQGFRRQIGCGRGDERVGQIVDVNRLYHRRGQDNCRQDRQPAYQPAQIAEQAGFRAAIDHAGSNNDSTGRRDQLLEPPFQAAVPCWSVLRSGLA